MMGEMSCDRQGSVDEPKRDVLTPAPPVIGQEELTGIVEALLFASHEPVSLQRLVAVIGDVTKAEVAEALKRLGDKLAGDGRGICLVEVAGGFRLVTKPQYASWVKRLDKSKASMKLSRSALESLAIIAYKQPIVKAEIEEIRGVETSGVVRTLLERKLVRIVGRKEVPGRPIMYGTTKYFLEHFGLKDLSELPPLREFKELGESEQVALPLNGTEAVAGNLAEGEKVRKVALSVLGDQADANFPTSAMGKTIEKQSEEKRRLLTSADAEVRAGCTDEPVEQAEPVEQPLMN
ncbi:MAG: SMC-Scp complex subunit ScpB [Nitrospira sp.]